MEDWAWKNRGPSRQFSEILILSVSYLATRQKTDLTCVCASLKKRNKKPLTSFKELGFLMKVQITLLKEKFNYLFFSITSKNLVCSQHFLHRHFETTRYTNRETTAMHTLRTTQNMTIPKCSFHLNIS